jgi:hypothetical protein
VTGRALGILGRLAQAGGKPADEAGALRQGRGAGRIDGGHGGRDSLAVQGMGILDAARRIRG